MFSVKVTPFPNICWAVFKYVFILCTFGFSFCSPDTLIYSGHSRLTVILQAGNSVKIQTVFTWTSSNKQRVSHFPQCQIKLTFLHDFSSNQSVTNSLTISFRQLVFENDCCLFQMNVSHHTSLLLTSGLAPRYVFMTRKILISMQKQRCELAYFEP